MDATIEIFSRDIKLISNIAKAIGLPNPQHLYIIHTNSMGYKTIIRGGAEDDRMFARNMEILKMPYQWDGKDRSTQPVDWDENNSHFHTTIAKGTDAAMQTYMTIFKLPFGISCGTRC